MQKRPPPISSAQEDELDAAMDSRFDAVSIRNIECLSLAARSVLATDGDHWRAQVAADAPEIRALVEHTLSELDYEADGRLVTRKLGPQAAAKVQDVYLIRRWLDENNRYTTSRPILQRRQEYMALLQFNSYELASLLGIPHRDEQSLELRLFVGMNNIAVPTSGSARLQ
jgi:hypothetical protein